MGGAMGISPSKGGAMGSCYGRRTAFYRPPPVIVLWPHSGRAVGGRMSRLPSIDRFTTGLYAGESGVL